jgi:ketosteroid isomerase-like protein
MNKSQEIASTMSGNTTWTDWKYDDMKVRVFGDVGIVTGRLVLTGASTQYKSGARRYTDVFVKRNGRWQIVECQSTLVP